MLGNLFRRVSDLFAGAAQVDDALLDELEEVLIASDVSIAVASQIMDRLREQAREHRLRTADDVRQALESRLAAFVRTDADDASSTNTDDTDSTDADDTPCIGDDTPATPDKVPVVH